jgi:hypothetical protein
MESRRFWTHFSLWTFFLQLSRCVPSWFRRRCAETFLHKTHIPLHTVVDCHVVNEAIRPREWYKTWLKRLNSPVKGRSTRRYRIRPGYGLCFCQAAGSSTKKVPWNLWLAISAGLCALWFDPW